MEEWLINTVQTYPVLTYAIIIFVSFVEGPILAMACGLLVKMGAFYLVPVYLALMIGDLIGDVFWYTIGRVFGYKFITRFGKYFSITVENVHSVTEIFHKYKTHILLISKMTMGFGFALVTLITAGMVKIPFKTYITLNIVGQLVWTAILLSIGYFLGHFYVQVDNVFAKVSIVAFIIIISLALVGFGKYIKTKMSHL